MRKLLLTCAVLLALPALAVAQAPGVYQNSRVVVRSSVTIETVLVSSYTMTAVETNKMSGAFISEVQNLDASNDVCCSFSAAASTVTASAQGQGCRRVAKDLGTWVIQKWWQNLSLYCQTLNTSGTSPVAITQGR